MVVTISKATEIEGWMSEAELNWLANQASRHQVIVEIGSYHGRSTRALGDNTSGIVFSVDTWVGPIELSSTTEIPSFETKFRENLADLILVNKVIPYRPGSAVLDLLKPDMIFIDGDHKYQSVKKDILYWMVRAKDGALLCGHDFSCLDVARAVGELIQDPEPVLGTDIWFTYL